MNLPNDTKIRFCNAARELYRHCDDCYPCSDYVRNGDGDLCNKGKEIIAQEMAYVDSKPDLQIKEQSIAHGVNCPKAEHVNPYIGYLHDALDDRPYDVDGCMYCGRCHHFLNARA